MSLPSFKEQVKSDIKNVFINKMEFADWHNVNGVKMRVVVDENELLERQLKSNLTLGTISKRTTLIYLAAEDFGSLPGIGSLIKLDGHSYRVTGSLSEGGMYSIHLEANKN